MPTTEITLRGLRLEVEFVYDPEYKEVFIREAFHHGQEVLCIMGDNSVAAAERKVMELIQEGKCHT